MLNLLLYNGLLSAATTSIEFRKGAGGKCVNNNREIILCAKSRLFFQKEQIAVLIQPLRVISFPFTSLINILIQNNEFQLYSG